MIVYLAPQSVIIIVIRFCVHIYIIRKQPFLFGFSPSQSKIPHLWVKQLLNEVIKMTVQTVCWMKTVLCLWLKSLLPLVIYRESEIESSKFCTRKIHGMIVIKPYTGGYMPFAYGAAQISVKCCLSSLPSIPILWSSITIKR